MKSARARAVDELGQVRPHPEAEARRTTSVGHGTDTSPSGSVATRSPEMAASLCWLACAASGPLSRSRVASSTRAFSRIRLHASVALADEELSAEPCNVVLTHSMADFDSLAGSVALAKLWSHQYRDVPTVVVMPRGANPTVKRFLAYRARREGTPRPSRPPRPPLPEHPRRACMQINTSSPSAASAPCGRRICGGSAWWTHNHVTVSAAPQRGWTWRNP